MVGPRDGGAHPSICAGTATPAGGRGTMSRSLPELAERTSPSFLRPPWDRDDPGPSWLFLLGNSSERGDRARLRASRSPRPLARGDRGLGAARRASLFPPPLLALGRINVRRVASVFPGDYKAVSRGWPEIPRGSRAGIAWQTLSSTGGARHVFRPRSPPAIQPESRRVRGSFEVPLLVLHGSDDRMVSPVDKRRFAAERIIGRQAADQVSRRLSTPSLRVAAASKC